MTSKVAGLLLAVLMVAGCRHASGQSSFVFVDPPMVPPPKSEGEPPAPVNRAQWREAQLHEPTVLPVYPARALKAKAKRATVGVRITVDTEGHVSGMASSMLVISTPGPFANDFRDAVETAVRQWRFTPARAEYYEIVHEGAATYNRATHAENVETGFDLAFTFTADGRVVVGK